VGSNPTRPTYAGQRLAAWSGLMISAPAVVGICVLPTNVPGRRCCSAPDGRAGVTSPPGRRRSSARASAVRRDPLRHRSHRRCGAGR
jgi:hypothetical protein